MKVLNSYDVVMKKPCKTDRNPCDFGLSFFIWYIFNMKSSAFCKNML